MLKGSASYKVVAEQEGIRNCTQLKVWVKKWQNGEAFDERKGNELNPLKGRPRTVFDTVEEERDYLKAQVDYLKKRYPNLVKEKRLSQRENYEIMEELRHLHGITGLLAIAGIPTSPVITNGEPHSRSVRRNKTRIMRSRNT